MSRAGGARRAAFAFAMLSGAVASSIVVVANHGSPPSSGPIEVAYSPAESSRTGAGWTCPVGSGRCITSAVLATRTFASRLERTLRAAVACGAVA